MKVIYNLILKINLSLIRIFDFKAKTVDMKYLIIYAIFFWGELNTFTQA
jgi:hypothetical protein